MSTIKKHQFNFKNKMFHFVSFLWNYYFLFVINCIYFHINEASIISESVILFADKSVGNTIIVLSGWWLFTMVVKHITFEGRKFNLLGGKNDCSRRERLHDRYYELYPLLLRMNSLVVSCKVRKNLVKFLEVCSWVCQFIKIDNAENIRMLQLCQNILMAAK